MPARRPSRIALPLLALCTILHASAHAQDRPPVDFIKINCGGPVLPDLGFLADDARFSASSTGDVGVLHDPAAATAAALAPVPWAAVYRSHRFAAGGILQYRLPVPPAAAGFSVGLMFAEQFDGAAIAGGRVMDLYINGVRTDEGIDVWSLAGGKINEPVYIQKVGIDAGADGHITIGLVPVVENPMLSGIVIEGDAAASMLWNSVAPPSGAVAALAAVPAAPAPAPAVVTTPPLGMPFATMPVSAPTPATADDLGRWGNENYETGEPIARHEACALMADGLVYLIGGRGLKDTSVYDPTTGAWWTRTGPPVEVNHIQCVFWSGRIWIGGSWYGQFPFEKEHEDMWVYDIAGDVWEKRPGLPAGRRRAGGAFVHWGGKLYLSHGAVGGHGSHATTTGWFDVYDPATNEWTALPDAPNARDHTTGAVVAGMLCVAGGRDGSDPDYWNANVGPVDCYSFASGEWSTKASLPEPRGGTMAGATCDGRLMVAGGEGKSATASAGKAYDRVDLLDVHSNTWAEATYMTSPRHGSGLAVGSCECGKIFVPSGSAGLGGGPEVVTMDVWSSGSSGEQPERCA